ncbi:MAG: undecaprenyl/decaprenyl-phosphate alpha-N-acetylglucosaminyl 1-phosphate transferase, partial [Phycisphaerales bacterium]
MTLPVLFLVLLAFAIACPATLAIIRVSRRLGALDTEPIPGQEKMTRRAIPNTGGIAIVLGFALPMLLGLAAVGLAPGVVTEIVPALAEHIEGVSEVVPDAAVLLLALLCLHALGLADDRRPLGPMVKLGVMLGLSLAVILLTDTRLLMLLDGHVGGAWLSIALTVLWFGVVINAMNFMDNMDGLAGGTAAVASAFFLAAALINGQWFIAACLALLLGACLGFLVWNFAPARIFMGDGGSLVLGFLLAFLTTRTTYYDPASAG